MEEKVDEELFVGFEEHKSKFNYIKNCFNKILTKIMESQFINDALDALLAEEKQENFIEK